MASIRTLKKEIDYIIEEILADCYLTIYFQPAKEEKVVDIIRGTVELRNDLYKRVNSSVKKENAKNIREHYMQVRNDLAANADKLLTKLSAVSKN